MILTDKEIRSLCESKKSALIDPFSEEALQSESYDLSIGAHIAVLKKEVRCLNLYDQEEVDRIYEELDLPVSGYTLSPKQYVLVPLKEKVCIPENITAHIRPRTRFTRLGLLVSDQHCNSTYTGKLQLGLFNATDYAVKIYPGIKIAQIVFEELRSVPSEQKMYKNKWDAAYQGEDHFIGAKISDELAEKAAKTVRQILKGKE